MIQALSANFKPFSMKLFHIYNRTAENKSRIEKVETKSRDKKKIETSSYRRN